MAFIPAAKTSELPDPGSLLVEVDDQLIVLIHAAGKIYALDDVCTHDGGPLSDGPIDSELNTIVCPRHGAKFDLATGEAKMMPATKATQAHEVRVEGEQILVQLAGVGSELSSQNGPPKTIVEDAVREALKEVIDPELFINIVDLGLICSIAIEQPEENKTSVTVEMTMTSPACPAAPQLLSQSQAAVAKMDGVDEADIKLVMHPPWSPERMTEDARDQLGIF